MKTFPYGPRLAVALAASVLLLSGCAGGGVESSSDAAPAAEPLASQQAGGRGEADTAEARDEAGETGRSAPATDPVKIAQERSIIYVAEMTVRAKDVTAAADKAKQIVTSVQGYLAQEQSSSAGGGDASATLVFKIPPAAYPATLGRLGKELGTREALQQNTEDVTEEVADVESRVKSAESALESLRALLKRANTIGEVLDVEREINNREAELESLQARQKALAAQTSMATLTLRLIGPVAPAPEPVEEESTFLDGLAAGWNALVDSVKVILVVLGALLPWLAVLAPVVWLALRLVRRRRASRTPARAVAAPAPPPPAQPAGVAAGPRPEPAPPAE
ncbi:uncharacterized protein (DUF2164 family) [Thermocatellispora tengchongensis]|uniref:Uncharacterized protein (DUF2164 family) n=1 Tax=Thermocatellispora tengchongensis TaxID=1073253 RepID=A0A840NW42_9ACTN|nr:DUF4349 domain-containing protein [Thermocatellispora tengchongensis]MBB5131029.1 uncharacterized protein (DUF2164 family) [Thermocatellispora tengchongensis]